MDVRTGRRADALLDHVDEGGHVVVGDLLPLEHVVHEDVVHRRRLGPAGRGVLCRDHTQRGLGLGGQQLDLEPHGETGRVAEERGHVGWGIARDHRSSCRPAAAAAAMSRRIRRPSQSMRAGHRVGVAPGLGQGRGHRRHVEHPAAGRVEAGVRVVPACAGMEDGHTLDRRDRLARAGQALDGVAQARRVGVAGRGQYDAHGGVAREFRWLHLVERAVRRGEEEGGGVGLEQRQDHLGLGVTEAHVVLDHLRSVLGQHEAGVEHAPVVDAAPAQLLDEREHGRVEQAVDRGGIEMHRCVGAHAPGVRPGVVVAHPFEVLGRDERHHPRAVAEHEERALVALEALLDHDRAPRVPEGGAGELGRDVLAGLVEAAGHPHALAGSQTVRLDHPRPGQGFEEFERLTGLEVVEGAEAGGGHAGLGEHLLHEGLRTLEQGAVGAGPEHGPTRGAQVVGQAGHQRGLGPHDVEVGLDLPDRRLVHLDGVRHARVARRDHDVRGAGQGVGERVLAAPAADDADPHAVAKETVCSRPGPTPTNRTGTPICSDRNSM